MRRQGGLVCYTAEELKEMVRRGESQTDWAKVDAMTEEALEASVAADPDDVHEPVDWSRAFAGLPPGVLESSRKQDVHIRLDSDILHWFKGQGRGYQTRINAVLRAFVENQKKSTA